MTGGILLLAIAVFGILVLFGKAKPEAFYKFAGFLIIAPVLLAIGINHVLWAWYSLPLVWQVVSLLLAPFLLPILFKNVFPKSAWLGRLWQMLSEALIAVLAFPVRLVWRTVAFVWRRERRIATRLDPYRPAVGSRPPLESVRRESPRRNDLFD